MNVKMLRKTPLAIAVTPILALAACSTGSGNEDVSAPELNAPSAIGESDESDESNEPITGTEDAEARAGSGPSDSIGLDLLLTSARAESVNLDDDREEFVEFCFSGQVQELTEESGFQLAGLKPSNRVGATDAQLVENGDGRCILASFPADTDVSSYTIGVVGNSVVENRSGEVNLQDSVPLGGGRDTRGVGGTNAPELLNVTVDATLDQISYVFDENELGEEGTANASRFGYYTEDGTAVTGRSVESVDDDTVIIGFGNDGQNQVDQAKRFFVQEGAVQDAQGNANTFGAAGEATAVPDLVSVKRAAGGGSQYDFRFDEAVQREQGGKFVLYTSDMQKLTASSVTRPSAEIVRATFSKASDFTDKIARAAVADGAVASLNTGARSNTIGAASLPRGGEGAGPTSGPDLLDVTLDRETGQATFVFDATLEEDGIEAASFFLVTDSGNVRAARDVVSVGTGEGVTGNSVVVLFDEATAQAAGLASVNSDAVQDQSGERNPVTTVDVS